MADSWPDRRGVADLLDLHEGRLGVPVLDDAAIEAVLGAAHRIAVLGASADPTRPSNGVMRDLRRAGYEVVPVNPNEDSIDGLPCHPTLAAAVKAAGPIDIVDVFRRPEHCPAHAHEAVAVGAGCLWLQLGIASREAGRIAHEAGLAVVMDRCTSIELGRIRRFGRSGPG